MAEAEYRTGKARQRQKSENVLLRAKIQELAGAQDDLQMALYKFVSLQKTVKFASDFFLFCSEEEFKARMDKMRKFEEFLLNAISNAPTGTIFFAIFLSRYLLFFGLQATSMKAPTTQSLHSCNDTTH